LIIDNAPWHRGKLIDEALANNALESGESRGPRRLMGMPSSHAAGRLRLPRKLAGYSMREIAAEHHLTVRHIRRELAALTEADRRRIERAWRDDLLKPGGWRVWLR
jgi:hypothetical protein